MAQQCPAWCAGCKQPYSFGLALAEICQTFWPATVPQGHGVSKISHTEPSQHCNITHWTHMEEMEWLSSALLGVLGASRPVVLAWLCTAPQPHRVDLEISGLLEL